MAKQIKVGVVGCGYWGPNLVRNFRSLPDCHLKMMCDISEERLKHLSVLYPDVKGEIELRSHAQRRGLGRGGGRHLGQAAFSDGQGGLAGGQTHVDRKADGGLVGAMRGTGGNRAGKGAGADGRAHFPLFAGGAEDQGDRGARATWAKSATSAPAGSTWACFKRTSTWRGIWRRTIFRSSFICWSNRPPASTAAAARMSRRGSKM